MNDLQVLIDEDRRLAVGLAVDVFWGQGFLAWGPGRIVKVNRMSVRVALDHDIPSPFTQGELGWPKGREIRVPRVLDMKRHHAGNCVRIRDAQP